MRISALQRTSGLADWELALKKQQVDELAAEAMIDGRRDVQVEFRAKIMDLAVKKTTGFSDLHRA